MGDLMAAGSLQRQNTVNMLDPLPDIDFFSLPVDDFFDSYVSELGAQGQPSQPYASIFGPQDTSSTGAPALPNASKPSTPLAPFMPAQQPSSDTPLPLPGSASTAFPDLPLDNNVLNSFAMPMGAPDDRNLGQNGTHGLHLGQNGTHPRGMHSLQAQDIHDSPSFSNQQQQQQQQEEGANNKSRRNPRQQQQNKAAQQRYRERRKQRFSDMEHVIDDLSAQLKQMSDIGNQNAMLQSRVHSLQQMVTERDAEISQLRQKVQSGGTRDAVRAPERQSSASNPEKDVDVAKRQVDHLRHILDANSLWDGDASGHGLPPPVAQQLSDAVAQACSACWQVARAGGLKVLEMIKADHGQLRSVQGCTTRWLTVIQALRLSEEQQEKLLVMRQNHLNQLKQVYIQRQALNLKAISLMATPSELVDGRSDAIERKLECMSIKGYGPCNNATVDLNHVLDAIKENLRLEQRSVMELNFVAIHRVLSTVQAAVYVVMKFPEHGTMLDLINVLARQLGRNDSSTSGAQSSSVAASSGEQGSASMEIKADKDCPLLQNPKQEPGQNIQDLFGSSDGSGFTAGLDMQSSSVQNMPF